MRTKVLVGVAVALAALLTCGEVSAQAKPKRKSVAVKDFEYGSVNQWWGGQYDIGKGMADQVVEALLADKTFRVIERKNLDTVLAEQDFAHSDRADPSAAKKSKIGKVKGIDYMVTGTITKFSMEQKGGGLGVKGLRLGGSKAKAEVNLTARLVDTSTGEVIASATGKGASSKLTGANFGKGGTSLDMGSGEFRDSALGDAQAKACTELVKELIANWSEAAGEDEE
jgi:curli biogenesis system outer membrane secretion channel CsgG